MELVILNIGLQEKVITPAVFAMMVIMAIVTTALTTPVLAWIYPAARFAADEAAAKALETMERGFKILIPISLPESGPGLARLARAIIGPPENGRVFALHLRRPSDRDAYQSGFAPSADESDDVLQPLIDSAHQQQLHAEPMTYVSRDIADDIAEVAGGKAVDLVLMGFHKPVFTATILGGTVHRVLENCRRDVAIFVDRDLHEPRRILVPYMGTAHDQLAMQLAERIVRAIGASATILHVVSPARKRDGSNARAVVERTFANPASVQLRVIEDDSPVDAVLRESGDYDLVVIGMAEQWGLESHLVQFRPERIASECTRSLLLVRRTS
jgi:nucleotide-binding universal stress UspA family protein